MPLILAVVWLIHTEYLLWEARESEVLLCLRRHNIKAACESSCRALSY